MARFTHFKQMARRHILFSIIFNFQFSVSNQPVKRIIADCKFQIVSGHHSVFDQNLSLVELKRSRR